MARILSSLVVGGLVCRGRLVRRSRLIRGGRLVRGGRGVSRVLDISNVARVAISNSVSHSLGTAVREKDLITAVGGIAVTGFIGIEVNVGIVVLDGIGILVLGGDRGILRLAVRRPGLVGGGRLIGRGRGIGWGGLVGTNRSIGGSRLIGADRGISGCGLVDWGGLVGSNWGRSWGVFGRVGDGGTSDGDGLVAPLVCGGQGQEGEDGNKDLEGIIY